MDGMATIFIVYDWTTNAILATPVKNMSEETTVSCFKQNIAYLTKRGFKPILNIIDNVASKAVQAYLEAKNVNIKLVEPHNHRLNPSERAIETFNNHLIAGLSICNASFPSLLWNKSIPQAQDPLNMLRTSRVHTKLSAYAVLEGIHDFNRHLWAPPRTRATIFNPPETRTSFGPRDIYAWYIGPDPQHYCCYNFFLPSTGETAQVTNPHSTPSTEQSQKKPRCMRPATLRHPLSRQSNDCGARRNNILRVTQQHLQR